jgi:hypothetical protein
MEMLPKIYWLYQWGLEPNSALLLVFGISINIIIIIIIIVILVITFMLGIYNYIPETNHVSVIYSVAAVLYLQSVLHVTLFRSWNMFCTFTLALSAVCVCSVQYGCFLLQFLNFVLSQYVAQELSEWFWNGSSRTYYYYWYQFSFTFFMVISIIIIIIIVIIIIIIWGRKWERNRLCQHFRSSSYLVKYICIRAQYRHSKFSETRAKLNFSCRPFYNYSVFMIVVLLNTHHPLSQFTCLIKYYLFLYHNYKNVMHCMVLFYSH